MTKKKSLSKLSDSELDKRLKELKLELFKEKSMYKVGAPVKSPGKIGEIKKEIARISERRSGLKK